MRQNIFMPKFHDAHLHRLNVQLLRHERVECAKSVLATDLTNGEGLVKSLGGNRMVYVFLNNSQQTSLCFVRNERLSSKSKDTS